VKKLWYCFLVVYFAILSLLVFNSHEVSAAEIDSNKSDRPEPAAIVTIPKDEPKFLGIPLICYISSAKSEANAQAQAFALLEVAEKYTKAGQKDKAVKVLDSSFEYLKGWDDISANAFARVKIATEYADAGQPERAISALEQGIPQIKKIESATDRAFALAKVASQYIKLGMLDKADPLLEQALASSDLIEDPYTKARALMEIAAIYAEAQNSDRSATVLEQSLQLVQKLDNPAVKARALIEVARTYATNDRADKVDSNLAAAAAASEIAGSGLLGAPLSTFNSRGMVYVANEYVNAGLYTPALDLAKRIADPYERSIAFTRIATKYAESNQNPKAARALGQALSTSKAITDSLGQASNLAEVASIYTKLGKSRNALKTLTQSLQATDDIVNNNDKVLLLLDIANQYAELGDRNATTSTLARIQDIMLDKKSQLRNIGGQLANVALIYASIGRHEQAMKIAKALDREYGRAQLVGLLECASPKS
jgi:tetratricopeptide (TPR) repeat protein